MRLLLWLRSLLFRRRLEREMREEMAAHLSRTVQRFKAQGLSHEDARRAARREFGNVDALRDDARDARGGQWLDSAIADLRYGFRQFARRPFSTMTMIAVLALGISFNSALFLLSTAFIDNVPPGVTPEPSLVRIRGGERSSGRGFTIGREFSYPEFREYAAQTALFSSVAAWTSSDVTIDVGRSEESLHSGAATYVTANYFQVLGVRPSAGAGLRTDTSDDAVPELSAVISHVVWDRYYGRAADVGGQTIKVNGVPFTIAGVAPRRFNGARSGGSQVRVWLPLNARPVVLRTTPALTGYDTAIYGLLARLQPGVREEQALPIAQAIATRAGHQMTPDARRVLSTDVPPLLANNYFPPSDDSQDEGRPIVVSIIPLLIPLLVLSITCTTVSALQAGLAIARRREIAVRLALGAPRRRIVRQLLTESVTLAFGAAALGLFVVWVLLRTFESAIPDLYLGLDWRNLTFTAGIALAAGVLFGLSPALHATRLGLADILRDGASAFVPSRSRLQAGLVVAQIALTQPALLAMGGLFLEIVRGVRELPSSAHADRILDVRFNTNPRYGAMDENRERALARVQARIAALPGVTAVIPQENNDDSIDVAVHTMDQVAGADLQPAQGVRVHAAPPGYFALMSMPIVLGRDFAPTGSDDRDAIIIGAGLARRLWGDADPIGRRLVNTGFSQRRTQRLTVVGVVDDSRAGGNARSSVRVFVPDVQLTGHFLIQTSAPAETVAPAVRSVANSTAPELPLVSTRTLATIEAGERTVFVRAIAATGGSGAVALLLSAIGLYAMISFAVGQRVREIGIRTALGADDRRLLALFLRRGLGLSLAGVCVGLALSVVAIRVISAVNGEDPPAGTAAIAVATTIVVAGVALVATWIPARRATRIDPLQALRLE